MTSSEYRNDPMFLRNHFNGDGTFEMPKIKKEDIDLVKIELIGYDKIVGSCADQIVHFFLDDYKFEVIWNDPLPRIEKLKSYKAVLSPNFSVYTEMPMPIKIYNTFRSRWCGAYLQSNGVKVIPTLAWGGPETFWFCFDGVKKKSVVAVSTLGVRSEKDLFIERIKKEIAAITDYSATIKKRKAELKESVDLIEQIIQEGAISDANLRLLVNSIVISEKDKKLHIKINLNAKFDCHKDCYDAEGNLTERMFIA